MSKPDARDARREQVERRPTSGRRAQERQVNRGVSATALGCLAALLLLPGLALARLSDSVDLRIVSGYLVAASLVTYVIYWRDKRKAQAGLWRTPESTLHVAEILGGWPGAFLAQRALRHKTAKRSYQIAFWAIVVMYQAIALDFLREWQLARLVWSLTSQ